MSTKINISESKKFLGCVFQFAEGNPILITKTSEIEIEDRLDESLLKGSPKTETVCYKDGRAELWGIPLKVSDTRSALLVEVGFTPSLEIVSDEGKTAYKVWLFNNPILEGGGLIPPGIDFEIPLPGVDGWRMVSSKSIPRYDAEKVIKALQPVAKAPPAVGVTKTATVLQEPPSKINDALVYGDLSPSLLERVVNFSFSSVGQETKPGRWKSFNDKFGVALEHQFSRHPKGDKNGFSFLQGNALDGVRTKNAMEKMEFLVLDLDTGESIENIKRRIAENGYFAIIYTTHSHMKDITLIQRDKILRYFDIKENPSLNQVRQFLQDVRGYQNEVVENLTIVEQARHDKEGVMVVVKHNPMQKFRVIFLLKEPFIFANRGSLHKEAMEEWGERYAGVSRKIGAFFDTSCVDPSRLFFTPRHAEDSPFEIHILAGDTLDLEEINRIPKKEWKAEASIWDKAAGDLIGNHKEHQTEHLMLFLKKYGDNFEFEDFIRTYDPDGDRGRRSSGSGSTWRCPNDAAHSNPGDEADKGFFCVNASESEMGNGFFAKCMHNSCQDLDRADFLDMICVENNIKNAMLLKEFVTDLEEEVEQEEEEEKEEELKPFKNKKEADKIIREINENTPKTDISNIARRLGISKIGRIDKASLIKDLARLSKTSATDIKAEVKEGASLAEPSSEIDDELANALSKYNETYGVILVGGKARVIKQPSNVNGSPILMDLDSFKIAHAPDKFYVRDASGNLKPQSVAKMWLEWDGRKYYPNGLVFEPKKEIAGAFNMWKGYPIKSRVGNWDILKDHIFSNVCRGEQEWYDWLITWMAQMIQHPGIKLGSAVAIKGKKGVGKSKIFEWLMHLMGPYSIKVANRHHITGNFNAHQKGIVLMVCEEAFWAGDMEAGGILKDMITSSTMMLEQKGFDPIQVSNYLRLGMISNEDWVTPASFDDERRFFVLECSNARQRDIEFFKSLDEQMYDGGAEGFMHYLETWKPPSKLGWDILRAPPKTPWLAQQAEESLDSLGKFLLLVAEEGAFPDCGGQTDGLPLNYEEPTVYSSEDIRSNLLYHLRSTKSAIYKIYNREAIRKSLQEILFIEDAPVRSGPKGLKKSSFIFPPLVEIHQKLREKGINIREYKEI